MLIVFVAIACAALWGMRQLGMSGSLKFDDGPEIDYPIDELISQSTNASHDKILDQLESSDAFARVPLESVWTNPFEWKDLGPRAAAVDDPVDEDPEEAARREREQREREIQSKLSRLELNSVMGGRNPIARISGELFRIGDEVAEFFVVRSISALHRSVVLEADGESYKLALGEP